MTDDDPIFFVEDVFQEATFDGNHIRGVLLAGRTSRNGYRYSETAFGDGSVFNSAPVFLDHDRKVSHPLARSVREVAGVVRNSRVVPEGVRGDVEVADTEAGKSLRSLVKLKMRDGVLGFSLVGEYAFNAAKTVVEKVNAILSTDLVLLPATTKNAFESDSTSEEEELMIEELKAEIAELKATVGSLTATLVKGGKVWGESLHTQGAKERTEIRREPFDVGTILDREFGGYAAVRESTTLLPGDVQYHAGCNRVTGAYFGD